MMPSDVALAAAFVLLVSVAGGVVMRHRAQRVEPFSSGEPTVYELASMVGGERRVAEVAAAFLVWNQVFEVRENTRRIVVISPPSPGNVFHPVEVAMINAAGLVGAPARRVLAAGKLAAEAVADGLPGLAVERSSRARIAAVPGVAGVSIALILGWWMWSRSSTGLALGWVPVVFALSWVVAGLSLIDPPYATDYGMRVIGQRRDDLRDHVEGAAAGVMSLPLVEAMTLIALVGRPAMTGGLIGLRNVLR